MCVCVCVRDGDFSCNVPPLDGDRDNSKDFYIERD